MSLFVFFVIIEYADRTVIPFVSTLEPSNTPTIPMHITITEAYI